ncbi:hypothetical protein ACFO5Q_13335 [Kordiimonas lipolytica]|uniref:Uncharacterized protein n=1 Tax=Kordiimonas lipolytica TaxID=1662421 RepID=A0ABV8UCF5_9PROT
MFTHLIEQHFTILVIVFVAGYLLAKIPAVLWAIRQDQDRQKLLALGKAEKKVRQRAWILDPFEAKSSTSLPETLKSQIALLTPQDGILMANVEADRHDYAARELQASDFFEVYPDASKESIANALILANALMAKVTWIGEACRSELVAAEQIKGYLKQHHPGFEAASYDAVIHYSIVATR